MNRKQRRAAQKRAGPASSPKAAVLAAAFRAHQAGDRGEAERLYREVLAAEPANAAALNLLGALLHQGGRTAEAISLLGEAVAAAPRNPDYRYNLGSVLQASGRFAEAATHLEQAVALKPGSAQAHFELATARARQGQLAAAEKHLHRVLDMQPQNADAMNNLALVLRDLHRHDEAMALWRRAAEINPHLSIALLNIGRAQKEEGRLEEAEESLRRALSLRADDREVLQQLAAVLILQDRTAEALPLVVKALGIEETPAARALFVQCLQSLGEFKAETTLREIIRRALAEAWTQPEQLAPLCASILKAHPIIGPAVRRVAAQPWHQAAPAQPGFTATELQAAAGELFLRSYLESTPNADLEIERFLTALRAHLLETARAGQAAAAPLLDLYAALARQCFLNEYIFNETEAERAGLPQLRGAVAAAMRRGDAPDTLPLVALAAYEPLHRLEQAAALNKHAWPPAIAALMARQIDEPLREAALRAATPVLTPVDDAVSLEVQRQYEQNPYPRWQKANAPMRPLSVEELLRQNFPAANIPALPPMPQPEVLIAGCGTGLHAVTAAQLYGDARILAIDISATSLAYARRQAEDMQLRDLEFAQADILKLASLDRRFDVIESVGVLHHLQDPFAGWSILIDLLRPGGVMKLGLYSAIARRGIVAAHDFVRQGNYQPDAEGIRLFRQNLMRLPADAPAGAVRASPDFFTTSTCRDLVFHRMEHCLTLPDIAGFIADRHLAFIGMETDLRTGRRFAQRFPDERHLADLASWHAFEEEQPDTFVGMYQFWVHKPVAA